LWRIDRTRSGIYHGKNLSVLPYHVPIKSCNKPKPGPPKREEDFKVQTTGVSTSYELSNLWWLIASTLSRALRGDTADKHHGVRPGAIKQDHEAVDKIKAAILSHGNPFAVTGDRLCNFITHAYVPQEYVPQILKIDDIGQKRYDDYVAKRFNGDVSLWTPVKKHNNKMYMSGNKMQTVKIRDQTVDLRETKDLYGRLMVLTRSNRDIDQKSAIGNYEFTLTPRALFAPDGSVLPC